MNELTLVCNDEQRRQQVRKQKRNGLDYVEVSDDQRSLCVHFLGPVPQTITKDNLRIEGGRRIQTVQVTDVEVEIPEDPNVEGCLRVFVDRPGDFSTYVLRLVDVDEQGQLLPLAGFDPRYAHIPFSFKVNCPSDLDCKPLANTCLPEEQPEPEINYLAKDYASFRQLILDRLSLIMPDWQERHIPDLGIILVELLAYVGDYLSYYQDAVATEAYLDTARQRISVRRHVRLVDYHMHEGCNARTWIWLETSQNTLLDVKEVYFITRYQSGAIGSIMLSQADLSSILATQYEIFEPVIADTSAAVPLYQAHNEIYFYTWGDRQCCLPKGATSATLSDAWISPSPPGNQSEQKAYDKEEPCDDDETSKPRPKPSRRLTLKQGDVLIFEEVKGAKTGNPADADPAHRHAVRLTHVQLVEDELYPQTIANVSQPMPTPVVEIIWATEDALPFSLCISAIGTAPACQLIQDISVAHGNVLLVDHGRTIAPKELGTVEATVAVSRCEGEGQPTEVIPMPARFYPHLKQAPLTFRQPLSTLELGEMAASKLLLQAPSQALPQITALVGIPPHYQEPVDPHHPPDRPEWRWTPQPDLLSSYNADRHFVAEIDNEGYAHLRFGDGELGARPAAGTRFFATCRIGSGTAGNIGADVITHIVFRNSLLSGITIQPHNPLPAKGGTPPEPLAEAKLYAPQMFRKDLQRAIAAEDYAAIVLRDFPHQIQRAAATLRWTGSWYEVLVVIDPLGSETASEDLLEAITHHLYSFRRIGHDVIVKLAEYVPLDLAITVCLQPGYRRGDVKAALQEVFSDRILPKGQRGFFHPDNLTFGSSIALSQLAAAAQAVTGVENVSVNRLQRLNEGDNDELASGVLTLNALEVARLDNDPSFPENGKLKLELRGGS